MKVPSIRVSQETHTFAKTLAAATQMSLGEVLSGALRVYALSGQRQEQLRNPEAAKARRLLAYAIKTGTIMRGRCANCGAEKAQAHHDDYSKPYEVRWLCVKCHVGLHTIAASITPHASHVLLPGIRLSMTALEIQRKGGKAKVPKGTAMLSPAKRKAQAKKAARARWGKRA